ncbi:MAG: hybrid sensor histidine kinase/response regulator [Chloroflexi bacterium]|nr:MAG: hybrid sensor histidine kinase/response regulator [Chloroflexota bacterium]
MDDRKKTKTQLIQELNDLRQRVSALENLNRRNVELELFNRIIATAATESGPDAILETVCRELALAFEVVQVSAAMLTQDKSVAVTVAEYLTADQVSILNRVTPVESNPAQQFLLQNRAPLVINNVQQERQLDSLQSWLKDRQVESLLLVPLIVDDEVVGSLEIACAKARSFSPEDVSLAWSVADQAAAAVSRAWLNEERHLLSTAIEQAADIILITDENGIILYANPAFERISGYTLREVVGKSPFIVPHPDQDLTQINTLWSTIKSGRVWHGFLTNRKKTDETYTVEATITPVRDDSGAVVNYVSTQRDVTRERELEKQYRQAQKMEAIGQLTAGIAHDFNNLLMAINGFAELMQLKLPDDSPFQDIAGRIVSSGESAANLIRQLLVFSRKQLVEAKIINLNNVVSEIDKMLRRIIGEDIDLQTSLKPDLWPVKTDPTQIEQIIVNLAVNARDAMPTGGTLIIETRNVVLTDPAALNILDVGTNEYVMLSVTDTGVGMSKEVKQHIFEPFFTTKTEGKGTGLGLATVYGIVKQIGGAIQVESEEGDGARFEIYIPRAVEAPAGGMLEESLLHHRLQGTETVLLVEDSSAVRELITLTLNARGYHVIKAGNGEEALRLFKERSHEIDLLLTDMIMPKMGGKELAERILEMCPDMKVIYTSGYSNDMISAYGILEPNIAFLQKPFSPIDLVSTVRAVLDSD